MTFSQTLHEGMINMLFTQILEQMFHNITNSIARGIYRDQLSVHEARIIVQGHDMHIYKILNSSLVKFKHTSCVSFDRDYYTTIFLITRRKA